MLGNQNLATVFQMSTLGGNFSWKNMAGQISYMNKTNRWNWGLVGGQVPYMTGGVRARTGNVGGVPAYIEETIIFRQTDRSAAGVVAYPFNRARRLEFQGGISQIAFDEVTYIEAYDLRNGSLVFRDTQEVEVAESLTMGTSSAALVFVDLRRHESGRRPAVSPRSIPDRGRAAVRQLAGRLPAVLHAGAVLHIRDALPSLRPLRGRR
jgi:hypothetical protein